MGRLVQGGGTQTEQAQPSPEGLAWGERVSHLGAAGMDSFICVCEGLGCSSQVPTCWEDVVVLLIGQSTYDLFRIPSESV